MSTLLSVLPALPMPDLAVTTRESLVGDCSTQLAIRHGVVKAPNEAESPPQPQHVVARTPVQQGESTLAKTISDAVREICLSFPEAEERPSRGSPDFRVRGKTFATYVVNHHGDGRIALWLNAPAGAQEFYAGNEPEHYFVPPYLGPRGWLGMNLDKGLRWTTIAERAREAYEKLAPRELCEAVGDTIAIDPPTETLPIEEFDPLAKPRAQQVVPEFREICLALPETSEATQFGNPVWKAGKKTFAGAHDRKGRLKLQFWAGADRQATLTFDPRYAIPPYIGHNGWIELDVEDDANWEEIEGLVRHSYQHFALKRMLRALDESA